ncbi:MAG: HNH endonuclease [Actinomycetes bacterium]
MYKFVTVFGLILVTIALAAGASAAQGPSSHTTLGSPQAQAAINPGRSITLGVRTQSSGCRVHNHLPDPQCTPGAVFSGATKSMMCVRGYSSKVRNVTAATKRLVYASYGIRNHHRGQYEVDHLVPLEGGGSNVVANLFPQPASPTPGFHQKDKLENEMRSRICYRHANIRATQRSMARNWIGLYRSWF